MKECGVNIKGASQFLETDITLQGEFLFDGSLQNRITEPLRLEKTSKIIKSNRQPNTTTPTKQCPEVPHLHVFWTPPGMVTPPLPWAAYSVNKLLLISNLNLPGAIWGHFLLLYPKSVALHGVVVTEAQDAALGHVKTHTVGLGPLIQSVQIPL